MARKKRIVIPGLPHHVTQRGVRRQDVFIRKQDREIYLNLLKVYSEKYGCLVIAYCLMTNHVHHLLIPLKADSLRWTLQLTHRRYAEYFNAMNGWSGHAWQEKFYSSPVDEEYFWITLRYIERNPVEAGIISVAENYQWSSAAHHCGLGNSDLITQDQKWQKIKEQREDWSSWLSERDSSEKIELIRKNTAKDLPIGSEQFLDKIEAETGLTARPKPMGRPKKKVA